VWIIFSSLAIAAFAVAPYFTSSLKQLAAEDAGLAFGYADQPIGILIAFYAHVIFAGIALLIGPFQFSRSLRSKQPAIHRALGRTYLVSVGIGGLAALVIAPVNTAGFVGFFGFGTIGVLWLWTAWKGYRSIRSGDVASHRAWMMRNFALTYAAVTLRLWILVLVSVHLALGGDPSTAFTNAYSAVPFLSWLPNLVVVELLIRRRGLPTLRIV